MSRPVYHIRRWQEHFETSESRKLVGPLQWVAIPTKHDGRGYKRVIRSKNGPLKMVAWWSLLQVGAKMPVHGFLADDDGPLTARDLSDKTEIPEKFYEFAFEFLVLPEIGWLEKLVWDEKTDLAGNCRTLLGLQQIPARASRRRQKSGDTKKEEIGKSPPRDVLEPQQAALPSAGIPADSSAPQQTPANTSATRQDKTRQDKTRQDTPNEPLDNSVADDPIQHAEAKRVLREFCREVFPTEARALKAIVWPDDLAHYLDAALPLNRDDWDLIEWAYRLPPTHPFRDKTRLRQTFVALLQNLRSEPQKIASVRKEMGLNGLRDPAIHPAPAEPDGWRAAALELYGPEANLPPTFAQCGLSSQTEMLAFLAKKKAGSP